MTTTQNGDLLAASNNRHRSVGSESAVQQHEGSPIDRLPIELLAQIFILSTPPTTYPLDLLKVCRHWKDVAYGTPTLWSSVTIGFGMEGTVPTDQLPTMIDRAGAVPLNVSVHLQEVYGATSQSSQLSQTIEVVNLIGDRVIHSLEILHLEHHSPEHLIEILETLMKPYQHLRSWKIPAFRVGWPESMEAWSNRRAEQLAGSIAHLASLHSLTGPAIVFFAVRPSYPLLQYLDMVESDTTSTLEKSLSALRDCPNLRVIKYEGSNFGDAGMSGGFAPISIPLLEQLELSGCLHIEDFLRNIDAPGLKELTLARLAISFESLEDAFTHLATHPLPLTKIAFINFNLSENQSPLSDLLHNVPHLTEFEFTDMDSMQPEYLRVLMDATVCPSMMRITFACPVYEDSITDRRWTGSWNVSWIRGGYHLQRPDTG